MLTSRHLNSLQYLRAIAALGVVLFHVEEGVNVYAGIKPGFSYFHWGHLGVPLFFVLSGFVISYSAYLRPRPIIRFLYGRLVRIYPVYLFAVLLFVGCIFFLPASVFRGSPEVSLYVLLKTLVFDFGKLGGYIYVGWTLFYELCFYLGFSCLVSRFQEISASRAFYLGTALLLIALLLSGRTRIADFVLGVVIFLLLVNPRKVPFLSPLMIALFTAVFLAWNVAPSSVFCVALVFGLCIVDHYQPQIFENRFFLRLGDSSYSIYLIQVFTISVCLKIAQIVTNYLSPNVPSSGLFLGCSVFLALLMTCAAGLAVNRYVEKPANRLLIK